MKNQNSKNRHKIELPVVLVTIILSIAVLQSCKEYDDFPITGQVVETEFCTSMNDIGYAIELSSPDSIGGTYTNKLNTEYSHVVVVYNADRILPIDSKIEGRIYLDKRHSDAYCTYHYTSQRGTAPEACFTEVKIIK